MAAKSKAYHHLYYHNSFYGPTQILLDYYEKYCTFAAAYAAVAKLVDALL